MGRAHPSAADDADLWPHDRSRRSLRDESVPAPAPTRNRGGGGKRLYYRIDRYAEEFAARLAWAGIDIINWHRPQSAYVQAYLAAGLLLRDFREPVPEDQSLRNDDYFEDWFRVPLFNIMRWERG